MIIVLKFFERLEPGMLKSLAPIPLISFHVYLKKIISLKMILLENCSLFNLKTVSTCEFKLNFKITFMVENLRVSQFRS